MQTDVLETLLYADMAENAKAKTKQHGAIDLVSQACDKYHLTTRSNKTEVVHKPAHGKTYSK